MQDSVIMIPVEKRPEKMAIETELNIEKNCLPAKFRGLNLESSVCNRHPARTEVRPLCQAPWTGAIPCSHGCQDSKLRRPPLHLPTADAKTPAGSACWGLSLFDVAGSTAAAGGRRFSGWSPCV